MRRIDLPLSHKISAFGLVCVFFVTMIHAASPAPSDPSQPVWWFYRLTAGALGRVAVPFYFAVAGFFLAHRAHGDRWWRREISKRVFTLVVPFFIWLLLWDCLEISLTVARNVRSGAGCWEHLPVGWARLSFLGVYPFDAPYDGPLWFVRALFLFALASPLIFWLIRRCGIMLPVVVYLLSMSMQCVSLSRQWMFFTVYFLPFSGLFYFSVGAFLAFGGDSLLPRNELVRRLLVVLGLLSGIVSQWMFAANCPGAGLLYEATLPLALYALWRLMPSVSWPARITSCTFAIYLIHVFVNRVVISFLPGSADCATLLFKYVCVFGCSLAIVLAMKRLIPRISSVVFGGR